MESPLHGLKEGTVNKICTVFLRHPEVERVILYGSRAMGKYRNGSDIDLTMVGEKVTHSLLLKIENELDDLLIPYKIDLSVMYHIDNAALLDHIARVGIVFYKRDSLPQ